MKGVDRISSLPDDVLWQILSLLDTKYAVATSILSTRWKHLPDLIPNIDVSDYNVGCGYLSYSQRQELVVTARIKFMQFVSKVVLARISPNLRTIPRFRLNCSILYDHNILNKWILVVLICNVRELDLSVELEESETLTGEIFNCKSLEILNLAARVHVNVPELVVLPNLKVLHLDYIRLIDEASIKRLLSSCPVLEELRLLSCRFQDSNNIEISHPLLKNLLLSYTYDKYFVILDTPNLQNLWCCLYEDLRYLVKNIKSLVHAAISWGSLDAKEQLKNIEDLDNPLLYGEQGTKLINVMHKVRSLCLEGSSLNALYFSTCPMATFENLTLMELGSTHISGWLVLPVLLASSPNLEVLVFFEGFINREGPKNEVEYCLSDSIPVCFSRSLKEIKVREFDGQECEFELLEYFLKSVQVLKMMEIGAEVSSVSPFGFSRLGSLWNPFDTPPKWLLPACTRLSKSVRCSKYCQIVLTWEEGYEKYCRRIL